MIANYIDSNWHKVNNKQTHYRSWPIRTNKSSHLIWVLFNILNKMAYQRNRNSQYESHSIRKNLKKIIFINTNIDIDTQVPLTDIQRRRRREKNTLSLWHAYMFMQNIPSSFALCDVFISIKRIKIHSNFSGSSPKISKQKVKMNESLIHSMRKNEIKQKIIKIQIAMINFADKPVRVLVYLI